MIFSISGSLFNYTRKQFTEIIRNKNHHVGDHVTDKTDYLICNIIDLNHKKVQNAIKYNIPIVSEEEALKIIQTE